MEAEDKKSVELGIAFLVVVGRTGRGSPVLEEERTGEDHNVAGLHAR